MRSFNSDVRVHPVLEELPPHAGPDDWGRSPSPSGSAWPARPPTEAYEPPSPPSTVRMQAQHALELGVMRDRLEFVRAVLSGGQEGLEGDLARSREAARELEMLREDVLQMAEREGRALTLDEERLLEKVRPAFLARRAEPQTDNTHNLLDHRSSGSSTSTPPVWIPLPSRRSSHAPSRRKSASQTSCSGNWRLLAFLRTAPGTGRAGRATKRRGRVAVDLRRGRTR